jgi:mono/diheme cytochrome c family protein
MPGRMGFARLTDARLLAAVALAAALPLVSACDNNKGDQTRGKELFTQRCGACHVLNDAGTKGIQGPNLDLAFKESVNDGLGRSTIRSVVRKQIELPQGGQMPPNLVKGDDADSVATYVANAVGKPPAAAGAGGAAPSGTARANVKNVVDVPTDPTGQLAFKYKTAQASAGKVTLETTNDASVPHNIALKGGPAGAVVSGGQTSKINVNLKPGSYTFYCSVPGHEQAGMKGTLTVR